MLESIYTVYGAICGIALVQHICKLTKVLHQIWNVKINKE